MGQLDGKAAIVTGGAGGIGRATIARFVEEGARVICADISDDGGDVAAQYGDVVEFVKCDVGSPDDLQIAAKQCAASFGSVDVLFNNAATSTGGYIHTLDLDGWDHSLKVMLSAALYGMQAAVPYMLEAGGGSIVNTSSVYGLAAGAANAPYNTAKAGLINLSRTAAVEYGRRGIRSNCICPGVVETPMFESVLGIGLKTREEVAAMHALGRTIQPEEIANLVVFLAGDQSSAITGQAIAIDGGLLSGLDLTGVPPLS